MHTRRRTTPKQQGSAHPINPKKKGRHPDSTERPKGSSISAKVRGPVEYTEAPHLDLSPILGPCARLGAWATALLSRAVTVVTPALSMTLAHANLLDGQEYEQPENVPTPALMNCDYAHAVLGSAAMAGLALSSYLRPGLEKTSRTLLKYDQLRGDYKYTTPPHSLEVLFTSVKQPTEKFLKRKLISLYKDYIADATKNFYKPLGQYLDKNEDDESVIRYETLVAMKHRCIKHYFRDTLDVTLFKIAYKNIEKKFFKSCKPPQGKFFYEFVHIFPQKVKTEITNILTREKITVEALGKYHYYFILKIYEENRDELFELVKSAIKTQVDTSVKELTIEYEAKITAYLQRQAQRVLSKKSPKPESAIPAADESDPSRGTQGRGAYQRSVSVDEKIDRLVDFQRACYVLETAQNIDGKQLKTLHKTVEKVRHEPDLRAAAIVLCTRKKMDNATKRLDLLIRAAEEAAVALDLRAAPRK